MTDKNTNTPKTALITGATVGLGYEFSKLFASDGYDLVLVARNEDKLQQRKNELQKKYDVTVNAIPRDLTDPGAPKEIHNLLQKAGITIYVLVNNAGFTVFGEFARTKLTPQLDMIRLNAMALTELTWLFLDDMRKRREGKILNVSSTAGFQPGPLMAVYYATKAYVLSFSEALAAELKDSGIKVSALCPGPTKTEFQKRGGIGDIWLLKGGMMSAESVTRIGYRKFMKGKTVIVTGWLNKLAVEAVRFIPRKLVTAIAHALQKRR